MVMPGPAGGEAMLATLAGGALGGLALAPVGLAPVGIVIGGVNGGLAGWRQVYDWRSARGVAAFVLDSTWSLPMTAAGLVALGLGALGHPGYEPSLSRRRNRQVHRRGFVLRRGFAVTWGPVVNGAAGPDGTLSERRIRLVTDHEDVHVWQARWFGPLYPLAYVGWMALAGPAAALRWAVRRDTSLASSVEAWAYYANPFEWWAYSRDASWPPRRVDARLVWQRPLVRPLRARRGSRGGPR
jgi:hypothetical protein